jgi:hypothetical protein
MFAAQNAATILQHCVPVKIWTHQPHLKQASGLPNQSNRQSKWLISNYLSIYRSRCMYTSKYTCIYIYTWIY